MCRRLIYASSAILSGMQKRAHSALQGTVASTYHARRQSLTQSYFVFSQADLFRQSCGCCAGQHPQHLAADMGTFPLAPPAAEAFRFDTPSPDDAVMLARSKPSGTKAATPASSRCEGHSALALLSILRELSAKEFASLS